jgi:putative PIN family toxin of toxin-antitoxin system
VVLDTNIFFSGFVLKKGPPRLVVESWLQSDFDLIVGVHHFREIQRILQEADTIVGRPFPSDETRQFIELIARTAQIVAVPDDAPRIIRDPKDHPILTAALVGNVDYLVSGDNDFLVLRGDERLGSVQIVTAREFLEILAANSEST